MIFSKYNIYCKKEDSVLIFNTLTGSLINLKKSVFDSIFVDNKPDVTNTLFKSGILIENEDDDLNKYKYMRYSSMFKKNDISLYICPTMRCNFSCFYCFEGSNKKKDRMSVEVEDAVVEYLKVYKNKKISIIWFGGEPLIEIGIIKSISDKLKKNGIAFSSSVITNGSLLTDTNIDILRELNPEFIQISMDGIKEQHDNRRFFSSKQGSFDKILSGINSLLENTSIPITIQVAIDKTNYSGYENLLIFMNREFPSAMSGKRITVNYNIVKDRTDFDKGGNCFNHEERYRYMQHIKSTDLNNKSRLFLPAVSLPCMYKTTDCYAIDPNGEMFKCIEHLGDESKSIGNLLKRSVSLKKLALCSFKYDCLDNDECLECVVFPICGGGCPLDREKDNGMNNRACSFYKQYIKKILDLLYSDK